jgi:hypothetical protein
MEMKDEILKLLEEANFQSDSLMIRNHRANEHFNIFETKFAANIISKHLILFCNSEINVSKYFVVNYDTNELNNNYLKNNIKISTYFNQGDNSWENLDEISRLYHQLRLSDFFNEAYLIFPIGWINETEVASWLKDRIKLNIPKKLIDVIHKTTTISGADYKEVIGEYIVKCGKFENKIRMRFDVRQSLTGTKRWTANQRVIETDTMHEFMYGWDMLRLRQFCTLNGCELWRVKVLKYL